MKRRVQVFSVLFLFLIFTSAFQAFGQNIQISGKVTDVSTGQTIPGVSILVKGTTTGTTTGLNGRYSLQAKIGSKLVFSFVGYTTETVVVGQQRTIDVVLKPVALGLNQVVVIGYATELKGAISGSVSTIGSKQLSKMPPASNAADKLQGLVSGVTVVDSHVPGGSPTVRVRGLGTINNNNPLYVIDGVPTMGGLSQINPNNIKSITVLKDASSTAIYGSRGANGVIIITTNRGTIGKPKVSFTFRSGWARTSKEYKMLNTKEYGQMLWLAAKNDGIAPGNALYGFGPEPVIPDYISPAGAHVGDSSVNPSLYSNNMNHLYLIMKANKVGTDWFKAIERTAPVNEYNLSVSGGTNRVKYAFSGGYLNQEGILLYTGFKRYSIRANTDAQVNKWFKAGESLGLTYTYGYGNRSDNTEGGPMSEAFRMQPIIPVYDIMGNFAGTKAHSTGNGANPVAILYRARNNYARKLRAIGNAYAQATPLKGLNFKTLFGFNYAVNNWKSYTFLNPEFAESIATNSLNQGNDYDIQWNWINTLAYNKVFAGKQTVSVLVGTEAVSNSDRWFTAGRTSFFFTNPAYMFLNTGEKSQTNSGLGSTYTLFSMFSRLNYDLMGKYILQATVRRDGSSRFGQNHKYAAFPAFSVAWRISKEGFMASTQKWLDYLKLRFGWGQTGNNQIGMYNGYSTYSASLAHSYYSMTGSNTSTDAGFYASSLGNPNAKWEETTMIDAGFNATLFNRFTITFDYWRKNTSNMLYPVSMPDVYGTAARPSINIGKMKNVGFDLNMGYTGKAFGGAFTYNVSGNISHYKNEIVKLNGKAGTVILGSSFREMIYTQAQVGTSFPSFFGYIVDGIFQTQAEVDAYPKAFGANGTYNQVGRYMYRDVNGDGVIDSKDRTYIGSPIPKFTGGLNVDLNYKGFGVTAFFYGSYGNKMVNYVKRWIDFNNFAGGRSKDRLYKSWGSPYLKNNADATLPKAEFNDQGDQVPSTAFIEDASYLRLRSLQLTYSLPKSLLNRVGVSALQIYLQGTNIFTLTKYSGLDPEVQRSGINMGIDSGTWPVSKSFLIGLKMDL